MTPKLLSFAPLFVLLTACAGGRGGSDPVTETNDELRTRRKPIEQVAQYAGKFEALDVKHGDFELKDDGSFVWQLGELNYYEAGNYTGPTRPSTEIAPRKLKFPRFTAEVSEGQWTADQGAPAVLVITKENGEKVEFESKYRLGGEAECDETHGHYTDDDLDRATGLNCLCEAPKVWRHAKGGCH